MDSNDRTPYQGSGALEQTQLRTHLCMMVDEITYNYYFTG